VLIDIVNSANSVLFIDGLEFVLVLNTIQSS